MIDPSCMAGTCPPDPMGFDCPHYPEEDTTMTDHNRPPVCTCGQDDNPECRIHGTDANRHPHYRELRAYTSPTDKVGIPLTHDPVTGYAVGRVPSDPGTPTPLDHCYKCPHGEGQACAQGPGCAYRRPPTLRETSPADLADHPLESLLSAIENHPATPTTSARARAILDTAAGLVDGDRNASYGDARDNFAEIAVLWGPVLGLDNITAEQVALCMAQVKVARLIHNPTHADSWVDGAGYLGLGGGIAQQTAEESAG